MIFGGIAMLSATLQMILPVIFGGHCHASDVAVCHITGDSGDISGQSYVAVCHITGGIGDISGALSC